MVRFCFKYLGFVSFDQVDRMTVPEYIEHLKVRQEILEEEEQARFWSAYLGVAAGSTDRNGKPKYKKFTDFYKPKKKKEMSEKAKRLAEFRRRKAGDGHGRKT